MEIVTGFVGREHITSEQIQLQNQGIFGVDSYILDVGKKLAAEIQSANEVRIRDGALVMQGVLAVVKANTYDPVKIQNGSQGMKRIDLIVCRYDKNAESQIENTEWVVIQGTPHATSPKVPNYTSGNIQAGDLVVDMPMYEVHINGITIEKLVQVAIDVMTAKGLEKAIDNGMLIRKVLTAKDDLDTLFENGLYWFLTGNIPQNAPFNNEAIVEVFGSTESTKQKIQRVTRCGERGAIAVRPIHNPKQSKDVWSYVYCGDKPIGLDDVLRPSDIVTTKSTDNSKVPGAGFFKETIDGLNTEIGKTVKKTDIVTVESTSNTKVPSAGYVKTKFDEAEENFDNFKAKFSGIYSADLNGMTCYYTYSNRILVLNIRGDVALKMAAFSQINLKVANGPSGSSSAMTNVSNDFIPTLITYNNKTITFAPTKDLAAGTWVSACVALVV